MKNNETGEFELVLGNKQLLSAFFIVVILFGVFFTMGYIVGRNSAPSPRNMAAVEPAPVLLPAPAAAPVESPAPPPAEPPAPETEGADLPQPSTVPAVEPQPASPSQPAPEPAPAPAAAEPQPGDVYLQVMAVKRPEAEVVLKTLREKGFRALLGQGPNDLVRVLVGPFQDAASLGQAKAGLENAGFHPIVRK